MILEMKEASEAAVSCLNKHQTPNRYEGASESHAGQGKDVFLSAWGSRPSGLDSLPINNASQS